MDRIEIKASINVDDAGSIVGTAWPFGTADRVGDVIEKGAFATPARLPMLFAHDQGQAIGVWDSVEETDAGLTVKGRLLIDDVARAREVRALVREGAVSGLSIGFVTKKSASRRGGGRTITALDLHEISIVPVPSHPGARIISAKAAGAAMTRESDMDEETADAAPEIAAIETKLASVETEVKSLGKIVDRLDKIEARLNRPVAANDNGAANDNEPAETKAFINFARHGVERMAPDEVKALTVANDNAGGYLVPEQFLNEIDRQLVLFSPIRQVARIASASVGEVLLPKRTGRLTASWVGETDERPSTQPAYGQQKFTVHELACYVDVSNRLLEDSAFNLEGELARDFAEEFGRAESAAFVNGDGDDKPSGLLLDTDVEAIETGTASAIASDDLIDLYHALPGFYAANGVWAMNRSTIGAVRKLKNADGDYLWQDAVSTGNPATILGRPVIEFPDMPDVADEVIPIVFGDFNAGFRIFDRVALSVLRDPYSVQTNGQVRFHARRRVGGAVSKAEAFKFLTVKAA